MQIKKAQRQSVKIKLAITGPSGSGKTLGAILLARGLSGDGRVLVIDSEDGSSNLYADHNLTKGIDYDVIELSAPYTTQKYLQALDLGQKEGYDVIVIDSISHAWAGEGGLLDKKSSIDQRGGNSYTNWSAVTKEHEIFKAKIVHARAHVIVTMRSKQEYVVELNSKGRQAPIKVGLAPVQRDGMEYEFTTVFDVAMDHSYSVSKDRSGLFDGRIEKLSIQTGQEIRQWLDGGAEPPKPSLESLQDTAELKHDDDELEINDTVSFFNSCFAKKTDDARQTALSAAKELTKAVKAGAWAKLSDDVKNWLKG